MQAAWTDSAKPVSQNYKYNAADIANLRDPKSIFIAEQHPASIRKCEIKEIILELGLPAAAE